MNTRNSHIGSATNARPSLWPQALIGLLVLVMLLALSACGGDDEEVSAGAGDDGAEQTEAPDTDSASDSDSDSDAGAYQATKSEPDMISAQKAPITEVVTIDDQTLGVRYSNGSEPCALANVLVEETDSSVTVSLETGLHPNVAAMSCIAQVIDYEIQVELASPIGDREIIVDSP